MWIQGFKDLRIYQDTSLVLKPNLQKDKKEKNNQGWFILHWDSENEKMFFKTTTIESYWHRNNASFILEISD